MKTYIWTPLFGLNTVATKMYFTELEYILNMVLVSLITSRPGQLVVALCVQIYVVEKGG